MKATNDTLERKLGKLYAFVPPPAGGLTSGRERMLAEAARLKEQAPTLPVPKTTRTQRRRNVKLVLLYKLIGAVLTVVVSTTVLGGGASLVAADSSPGDILYPVKLFAEDVRLTLANSPATRAELHLAFTGQRAKEISRLVEQEKVIPEETLNRMTQHIEQAMVQIAQARPEEAPALLQQATERMRTQKQALEQTRAAAPATALAALGHALEITERAYQALVAAQDDPTRLRQEYQHRHKATPGLRETAVPDATRTPARERNQQREQRRIGTPTATPQQHQEREQNQERMQNQAGTPTPTAQQNQEREQNQFGRPTDVPQQNQAGTPTPTPQQSQEQNQNQTQGPGQNQDQNQNQDSEPNQNQNSDQNQNQDSNPNKNQNSDQDQNGGSESGGHPGRH